MDIQAKHQKAMHAEVEMTAICSYLYFPLKLLLWIVVTHLFLTGWMFHISFIPVLSALQWLSWKRGELFLSLTDQMSYEDFSDSCVLLQRELFDFSLCSCSWLGCFCCSFQGPWGLNQGTAFLVQGFLSWAFSWWDNLGSDSTDIKKKKKFVCFATPQVFLSPLVAAFKTTDISLGFCFQRFFLL